MTEDVQSYLLPSDYLESVGFCYTYFCDCECEHCCSECGPWRTEKIDPKLVVDTLHQAKALGTQITGFTGGEALAYADEILWIMHQVKHLNIKFTIATNCSFGKDRVLARTLLLELKSLGVVSLFLSYDVYHAQFVPITSVRNVLSVCKELSIPTHLYSHQRTQDASIEAQFPDKPKNELTTKRIIPIGRASHLNLTEADWNDHFFDGFCDPKTPILIHPDGAVFPCCATGNLSRMLVLGYIPNEPLSIIVERYRRNSFFRFIKTRGFKGLYEVALELDQSLPTLKFVDVCSFCKYIIESPVIMAAIKPLLDANDIMIGNEILDLIRVNARKEL